MIIDREKLTKTVNGQLDKSTKRRRFKPARYQQYFEGYTTYTVKSKNGKGTKTIRLYTDDYYTHDCDDRTWVRQKVCFALLSALAVALYLLAALGPSGSTMWPPVEITGSLTLAALLMYVAYICFYISSPRLMTHWTQEHYHKRVRIFSLISFACLALTAVLNLAYTAFVAGGGYLMEIVSSLEYAIGAAAIWYVWHRERNTDYRTVENDAQVPELAEMVIPTR